tara:strand:- start:16787 stop:16975 length:189 start_codon:yes stop_codon:yes gene_type:complete
MAGLVLPRKERKALRREEAIERNAAYQQKISTAEGIKEYINDPYQDLGTKQLAKLEAKLSKL